MFLWFYGFYGFGVFLGVMNFRAQDMNFMGFLGLEGFGIMDFRWRERNFMFFVC